ncbi:biliverdin-producing heme oxygenase [Hymenobacter sp. NST-14]|uniref:biliverdin-producing heme oxygenase n=1 Tax=Hymenobacter piscis TaxID=2839984 RepID=UPI001C01989E|nr:biliverdin-producing heme oxygenase [Hymenobacter piscis]MBT9391733.1 biliverdin-producing heme oxygenase [Hymenobacter piscis]
MSFAAAPLPILTRLRQETRPAHEALEQQEFNRALGAGTLTAAVTHRFLAKLYGFVVPYEEQLRQHAAEFGPEWELERRARAHLLRQDLPHADELPLASNLPPLRTRAQLLGALYVMEGSTLGGQVIARQLAKNGIPARAYFSGHAEQTGPLWKSFTSLLTEAATSELADDIVASATLTFQRLHQWIESDNA